MLAKSARRATSAVAAACLLWSGCAVGCAGEGDLVEVSGTISREAFSVAAAGARGAARRAEDVVYILNLDDDLDVCTQGTRTPTPGAVEHVRRFQLFRSPDLLLPRLPVIFARAHVRGRITVGLTGPYYTPAAIEVGEFRTLGDWAPPASIIRAAVVSYLPVTIEFRRPLLASSRVAEITNHGAEALPIVAECVPRTGDRMRRWSTTIAPGSTWTVGPDDGWTPTRGDRLLLRSQAFADVAVVVP